MEEKEGQSKLKLEKIKKPFLTTKPQEDIIRISCPSCNEPTTTDNINIHDKIAKCGSCAAVFSFQKEIKNLSQQIEKVEEENLVRPAGVEKSYYHDELELTMEQPNSSGWIAMVIFSVFFAGLFFLLYWEKGLPLFVPSSFAGLSLYFFYKYWNRKNEKIFVVVDDEYLSVQYRPNNLVKDRFVNTQEVEQIYVKCLASNYYSLYAILNTPEGQKHFKLITYIGNRNKARYIEREIEMHLGIEDRRVPEEQIHLAVRGGGSGMY